MAILDYIPSFSISESETELYAKITEINFALNFSSVPPFEFDVEWFFGDGTTSKQLFPKKTYSVANDYVVRCIVFKKYDGGSDDYVEYKKNFRVQNYINDKIWWLVDHNSVYQCKKSSTPFKIGFSSSLNEFPKIKLFSENSKSIPYEIPQNKYSHLKPQWKFTNPYTVSVRNEKGRYTEYLPINEDNVQRIYTDNDEFLGLSGFGEFYYIDDLPSDDLYNHSEYPNDYVTLVASLEFSDNNLNVKSDDSDSLLKKNVEILPSTPDHLMLTHNGIKTFTLDGIKWIGKNYKLNVAIVDSEDNILKQYPINNSNNIMVNLEYTLSAIDLNGTSIEMDRIDSKGFGTGGYIETIFVPLSLSDSESITASCSVLDYSLSSSSLNLSGESDLFDVKDYYDNFRIVKKNENFDMYETLKSYAFQHTIRENATLWDVVVKSIVGDIDSDENEIGKLVFEKVSNFVINNPDIDSANIESFYGLFQELGQKTPLFLQEFPAKIKRLLNLFSINLNKLAGGREKFGADFGLYLSNKNVGEQITTNPFTINAGEKFVFRTRFSDFYELVEAVNIDGDSSYDIDLLAERYGFNLPVFEYYDVYRYVEHFSNVQNEGIINWDASNLYENLSYDDWMGKKNVIESSFDFYLREGLKTDE